MVLVVVVVVVISVVAAASGLGSSALGNFFPQPVRQKTGILLFLRV